MENKLKSIRKNSGYSLEELGDMCGMAKSQIWTLEQGESAPRLDTAYKIAKVLGVTVYEIWPDYTEVIEETVIKRRLKKAAKK